MVTALRDEDTYPRTLPLRHSSTLPHPSVVAKFPIADSLGRALFLLGTCPISWSCADEYTFIYTSVKSLASSNELPRCDHSHHRAVGVWQGSSADPRSPEGTGQQSKAFNRPASPVPGPCGLCWNRSGTPSPITVAVRLAGRWHRIHIGQV